MGLKEKALSGLFWAFSQQFSVQLINFVVQLILARLLSPTEFGLIAMLTVFIAIGSSLMDSGMTSSLIRTENPDNEDYSTVFFINLIVSFIVYLILYACAPLISSFYDQPILTQVIRLYGLSFVFNALSGVQIARLTKEMKFKIQMAIQVPSVIAGGLLGVVLAYLNFGVWSLVWMNVAQTFLFAAQFWIFSGWLPSLKINKKKLAYHFNFGYKLTISGLINAIFDNAYNIIIGKFFSAHILGFYNRAYTLQLFPVKNIATALNKVTYPMFASLTDDQRLKLAYKNVMQQVMFWVSPFVILAGVLAKPLFIILLTEKWLAAVPYFQILCVVGVLFPMQQYNLNILRVKGRSDLILRINIIKKSTFLVGILIALPLGIKALLIAQAISSVFSYVYNSYYSGKFIDYGIRAQLVDILPILTLAIIIGGLVKLTYHLIFLQQPYMIQVVSGLIIGIGGYLGLAFSFRISAIQEFKRIVFDRFSISK